MTYRTGFDIDTRNHWRYIEVTFTVPRGWPFPDYNPADDLIIHAMVLRELSNQSTDILPIFEAYATPALWEALEDMIVEHVIERRQPE